MERQTDRQTDRQTLWLSAHLRIVQLRVLQASVYDEFKRTATSFFLPHQNLAKSHHLSSGAKDSKPLKYINTDIREQNIYDYD